MLALFFHFRNLQHAECKLKERHFIVFDNYYPLLIVPAFRINIYHRVCKFSRQETDDNFIFEKKMFG